MIRNLILSGGVAHGFERTSAEIDALLAPLGVESTIETDLDDGWRRLTEGGFDVVMLNALRWEMRNDPKYEAGRARWGYKVPPAAKEAVAAHLARGGGLVGMHTASICFDDWPEWRDILGGAWVWGISRHDAPGPAAIRLEGGHALLDGLADFTVEDEIYTRLSLADDVEPIAWARPEARDEEHPVLWVREVGGGRVVYDALGHDIRSIASPEHRRLIARCVFWAAGRDGWKGEA